MKKNVFLSILISFNILSAQQNGITSVRDGFIGVLTDAIASGQGDIGVATSPDAFSQSWNPSKYMFSDKKFAIGVNHVIKDSRSSNNFDQLYLSFYNKLNNRNVFSLSIQGYSYSINQFQSILSGREASIDGSYTLRLSDTFAMSVGGRFISLKGKSLFIDDSESTSSLYGVDVSGFYYGNEIAYIEFNGRWRAGFNFTNLRGKSLDDTKDIEIYAPTTLSIGAGFDFIFDKNNILELTGQYEMLLDLYAEDPDNPNLEKLDFGLQGSVMAMGFAFEIQEKLITRSGYSQGINKSTDSFISIGAGFKGKYVDVDFSCLLGVSIEENPIRERSRLSLVLNLDEAFSN